MKFKVSETRISVNSIICDSTRCSKRLQSKPNHFHYCEVYSPHSDVIPHNIYITKKFYFKIRRKEKKLILNAQPHY